MNTKVIHIRFNLDKERHRRAWDELERMCRERSWSYSNAVIEALLSCDSPRIPEETVQQDNVRQIVDGVRECLLVMLPAFVAGASTRGATPLPEQQEQTARLEANAEAQKTDTIPDEEIPWDYLGE